MALVTFAYAVLATLLVAALFGVITLLSQFSADIPSGLEALAMAAQLAAVADVVIIGFAIKPKKYWTDLLDNAELMISLAPFVKRATYRQFVRNMGVLHWLTIWQLVLEIVLLIVLMSIHRSIDGGLPFPSIVWSWALCVANTVTADFFSVMFDMDASYEILGADLFGRLGIMVVKIAFLVQIFRMIAFSLTSNYRIHAINILRYVYAARKENKRLRLQL